MKEGIYWLNKVTDVLAPVLFEKRYLVLSHAITFQIIWSMLCLISQYL